MPKNIVSKIDAERGDVPRSRFLLRLLEKVYANTPIETENNETRNKSNKPLQTDSRVGRSGDQNAMDDVKTTPGSEFT